MTLKRDHHNNVKDAFELNVSCLCGCTLYSVQMKIYIYLTTVSSYWYLHQSNALVDLFKGEGVSYIPTLNNDWRTIVCVLFIFHADYSYCGLRIVAWTGCIAHVRKLNRRKKKTTNIDHIVNTPPLNITSFYIQNDQHQNEAIKTNNVRNCPHLNGTSLGKLYNVIVIESRMPCKLQNKKSANQLTAYLCAYEAENCIANAEDLLKRNHKNWKFAKPKKKKQIKRNNLKNRQNNR